MTTYHQWIMMILEEVNLLVHIKWDEATAVLVGDALQAFAYQILSDKETHPKSEVRLNLIKTLAEASGLNGMVLGQSKDLEAEKNNKSLELKDIINLQKLKTGALFNWSLNQQAYWQKKI